MTNAYMPKSKSDRHLTPDKIFDMIKFHWGYDRNHMYDPVPEDTPHNAPMFFNGLYLPYHDVNFVNPPYAKKPKGTHSDLALFVFKSIAESYLGRVTIMLLPAKVDQPWFFFILACGYQIVWIEGRLKFKNNKWSATGSHFLVKIE